MILAPKPKPNSCVSRTTAAAKYFPQCLAQRPTTRIGLICIWTFRPERLRSANKSRESFREGCKKVRHLPLSLDREGPGVLSRISSLGPCEPAIGPQEAPILGLLRWLAKPNPHWQVYTGQPTALNAPSGHRPISCPSRDGSRSSNCFFGFTIRLL